MLKKVILLPVAVVLISLVAAPAAWATGFTVIPLPTSIDTATSMTYVSSTNLIDISGLTDGSSYSSVTDGFLTVSFSSSMIRNTVGASWGTWNCPPYTESCMPPVLWSDGASSVTMTLSSPESTFGFEAEPDNFIQEQMTAIFYNGASVLGSITLDPNGDSGALLFAASDSTPFTSVQIANSAGDDFAIANIRYSSSTFVPAPEPPVALFVLTGLAWLAIRKWQLKNTQP
jgi:hypothetical protein